ncbi:hypothetical protein M758_9G062900 [Ceratodon purpureus]|uniref:t-SNARE coiled-coil homology domain-containing protein n=1 Tax=Ceratodon purpureus TaxID=3225 RepID=A0A8T0GVA4_CERPU|nr:hypothetical protein KC19_9G078800 [Ceratodon purpureus]KAG0605481.1 hypothetical protein M758_9G062900 [Ceratodon purpureus]
MAWTDDNLGRRRAPGYSYNSDQVQLRVDPRDQLDEEIYGLRGQVAKLKQVAGQIESETKYQNELLNQLEETVAKGQAMLKSTMRKLNRNLNQRGISPLYLTVGFALLCFFFVYLYIKFFRRR